MWSVDCRVECSGVRSEVRIVECRVWSVKWGSGKCRRWSAECRLWSVEWAVWSEQCGVQSVECEVYSVERGV